MDDIVKHNIEDTKPIDVLATRVWSGTHWHYPHIETMIAEIERLRYELARRMTPPPGHVRLPDGRDVPISKIGLEVLEDVGKWSGIVASFAPTPEAAEAARSGQ